MMKATRMTIIGIILLVSVSLVSLFLTSLQDPVLAAAAEEHGKHSAHVIQKPQANITVVYTNTNIVFIPAGSCPTFEVSNIFVPEDFHVYNVKVGVNVTHPSRGDLEIHLLSPDFIGVQLIGQSPSTFADFDVWFDSDSPNPPEGPPGDHNHDTAAPYYDFIWHPEGDLGWLYQFKSFGDWTLQICDGVGNSSGQLNQWTLELELGPPIADLRYSYKTAPLIGSLFAPITYTIQIDNSGGLTSTNTTLNDPLPNNTTFVTGSLFCNSGTCNYNPTGTAGPAVEWSGELIPHSTEFVTFSVLPQTYGTVQNTASITSTTALEDIWVYAQTTIYPEIFYNWDFEFSDGGFIGSGDWQIGNPFIGPYPPDGSLYLWGTNLNGDYTDPQFSDLSKSVDLTGIPPEGGIVMQWWEWYALDTNGDYGELTANGQPIHTVAGTSDGWILRSVDLTEYSGQVVNLVWTLAPNGDGLTDLGWYIDNVTILAPLPQADLDIMKEGSANPAVIGETLFYTVTVHNSGPYTATDVHIYDYLPSEVHLNSVTPMLPGPTCWEDLNNKAICTLSTLSPGEAIAIVLDVTPMITVAQHGDQILNYAYTYALEEDPTQGNSATSLVTHLTDTPITAPQVYSVTPESAVIPLTGKVILIDGENFTVGMSAYLGGYQLQNVTRITSKRLGARVPNSIPAGTYDLKIVAPNAESGILLDAFTVLADAPPTPTRVIPERGLSDIPVNVYIYGTNFSPSSTAHLYDQTGTFIAELDSLMFIGQHLLRGVVPKDLPIGIYDLKIIDSRGDAWLYDAYEVLDPASYDDLFAFEYFDLWTQPPSVQQGDTALVGGNIRRRGGQTTLADVEVDYYRGDPGAGGVLVGRATATELDPRAMTTITRTWNVGLDPGIYTFYGVIDPDDAIPEDDEENNIISHSIRILPSDPGYTPLQIDEFTINLGAKNTDRRQVHLDVNASGQPAYLLFIEYQFFQSENTWVPVARSDWLVYGQASTNFPWKLHPTPGVHYIQVWAADRLGNITIQPGMAAINLVTRRAQIAEQEVHLYRYKLPAGQTFMIRLLSWNGDVDLYVWGPDGTDIGRSEVDQAYDELYVTSSTAGVYQVEVEGYTSANYHIEFIPLNAATQLKSMPQNLRAPNPRGRGVGINNTSPGENTGLPEVPQGDHIIYLPTITR